MTSRRWSRMEAPREPFYLYVPFSPLLFKAFQAFPLRSCQIAKEGLNKTAQSGISILRDKKFPLPVTDLGTQKGNVHLLHSPYLIQLGAIQR
jgi:hypothetical protein